MSWQVLKGDCREVMKTLADCSVDAVVSDPPYELGFMGKSWDRKGIAYDVTVWSECLRVLKPGGHLLAFGGSRTYHRLACAIEDAGFEIRDQIQWLYGSGFPKSLDVSKAIDFHGRGEWFRENVEQLRPYFRDNSIHDWTVGGHVPSDKWWSEIKKLAGGGHLDRDVVSILEKSPGWFTSKEAYDLTIANTDAAKQWNGWGTALKPAHEPIVMARKSLIGTVAENVLKWGTGGINVDGCRISGDEDGSRNRPPSRIGSTATYAQDEWTRNAAGEHKDTTGLGRWPANVIHDGSDEVLVSFPETESAGHTPSSRGNGGISTNGHSGQIGVDERWHGVGSAGRFFYCAKADQQDRNEGCEHLERKVADTAHKRPRTELDDPRRAGVTPRKNHHPTVKPTDLMRYLCRLVTPPGGLVLDPFCGSGSTGKAALMEGLRFIGIELEPEYVELAQLRIGSVKQQLLSFEAAS